jgi:DNA-binding transcriptional LysR family regulator
MHTPFDLEVFIAISDTGSLTEAARLCGVARATVTRHLDSLEESLGVALVHRSTRKLTLTEAGQMYSASCRDAVAQLRRAASAVRELDGKPRGSLRLSMPIVHLERVVAPLVAGFTEAFPDVDVQVTFSSDNANPLADGTDVALYIGFDTNPQLITRVILREQFRLVASPAYLARRGTPSTLEELRGHDCIVAVRDGVRETWPLGGEEFYAVNDPRLVANSMTMMRAAAVQGVGIAFMARSVVHEDLKSGALVTVLPERIKAEQPVSLLYAESAKSSPRVRCFVDFAVSWVAKHLQ